MVSQTQLGEMFRNGATTGAASNVHIADRDGYTALIGYGWACYATRDKATGEVTYYKGWYGYSPSTSCQLSKLGLSMSEHTSDESPTASEGVSALNWRSQGRISIGTLMAEAEEN